MRSRFKTRAQRQETGLTFEQEFTDLNAFGGGGGGGTTVQKTELDPIQRRALQSVIGKAEADFARGPAQFFPGQTLADVNPLTTLGQETALAAAGDARRFANVQSNAIQDLLATDFLSDPRTQRLADAAVKPIERQFTEQILPSITSRAVAEGAFGGSRQDISEALAARDFGEAALDARARVLLDAQRADLNARTAALQLAPNVTNQLLLPSQIQQQVGAQRTAQEQAIIDAARERFEFEQIAPDVNLDQFASRVTGINLGGTTIAESTQRRGGLFGK